MNCTIHESIGHKNNTMMLPSTISWVRHHQTRDTIMNGCWEVKTELHRPAAPASCDAHQQTVVMRAKSSKIIQNHDERGLISEDCVWWGIIRQPLNVSSSSSSSSSLSSFFPDEDERHDDDDDDDNDAPDGHKPLDQACEIMTSSIRNDEFNLQNIQNELDLQTPERSPDDEYKRKQYRRDLLTDDMRMFHEQLELSRSPSRRSSSSSRTPSTSIHLKNKLY